MLTDCSCRECGGDCPELAEDGELCISCRHGIHPTTDDE